MIMRVLRLLSLTLLLGAFSAVPAMAQQGQGTAGEDSRILTSSILDSELTGHESAASQQRAQLADLLASPDVQELARDRGIDMNEVEAMALGLTDGQVNEVAPMVAKATAAMQSGRITISVGALIIILLILILVS
jgi:pyruvate/2-oxoglutarate dehydrogenase complex dihydrolipoamide acyltransferase (E2) component